MRAYFYEANGVQFGPIPYGELIQLRLPRDTMVWYQGLSSAVRADKLPALKEVPLSAATDTVGISTGQPSSLSILDADFDIDGKPKDYKVPAIVLLVLSLITCSIFTSPFAITTMVFSTIVNSKYRGGFFMAAENFSKYTKIGLMVSGAMLVIGLLMSAIPYLFI